MSNERDKQSFWTTLPGILTGIAAILSAVAGLYIAMNGVGNDYTPTPTPHISTSTPTPYIPKSTPDITVTVNTYPRTILAGGSTEISVIATSGDSPVSGANVKIYMGGGVFADTGNTEITGVTDNQGVFRTIWHTYEKSAYTGSMSYGIGADVSKSGYNSGHGEGEVFITV